MLDICFLIRFFLINSSDCIDNTNLLPSSLMKESFVYAALFMSVRDLSPCSFRSFMHMLQFTNAASNFVTGFVVLFLIVRCKRKKKCKRISSNNH